MIYLITFWDEELKQRIAFLVQANSRTQAKRIVRDYCMENHFTGWMPDQHYRSHLMCVDNEHLLQRIDTLVE